jgi:hypothetical protein
MDKFLYNLLLFLIFNIDRYFYARSLMNCYILLYRVDYIITLYIFRVPPASTRLSLLSFEIVVEPSFFKAWLRIILYRTSPQFKGLFDIIYIIKSLIYLFQTRLIFDIINNNLNKFLFLKCYI